MKLFNGDSLDVLKTLKPNSVDSVVTDPPYGLAFMGKRWDYDIPSKELWIEVLRVLKPGGHLLSFGGTRTYHRMVVNIEDAGFEIRDQIQWLYGSGFPKSHNISKGIDKKFGAEREVIGKQNYKANNNIQGGNLKGADCKKENYVDIPITAPATQKAKQWDGFGTALKPSNEPIVLARKPLSEKTIVDNVLKHGTGGLNIDGCRVEASDQDALAKNWDRDQSATMEKEREAYGKFGAVDLRDRVPQGRFPANIILDECAAEMLDLQSGERPSGAFPKKANETKNNAMSGKNYARSRPKRINTDSGGASRFFYCAKASKSERNAGLEGIIKEKQGTRPNSKDETGKFPDHDHRQTGGNNHPTVKPIKLMSYLVKLVTPPSGIVLDPFMGSGTTGLACKNNGFDFVGIEREKEYLEIAKKRIG